MAERATVAQTAIIGVQATAGTPTAQTGFHTLGGMGLTLTPAIETKQVRPAGAKYPTISVLGKDSATMGIDGDAVYEDLFFALSSALCTPSVAAGVNTFTPKINAADTIALQTVQKGETGGECEQVHDAVINDFSMAFSRDAIELSGSYISRAIAFDKTKAPAPTARAVTPMLPTDVCVFWDPTSAALGTTKLLRVLTANWGVAGRQNPLFVLDCTQPSYVAVVEGEPNVSAEVLLEVDEQGIAFYRDTLRTGAKGYLRIECNQKSPGTRTFKVDTCCAVQNVSELSDQDGVYAYTVSLVGVADPLWGTGKVTEATVKDGTTNPTPAMMKGKELDEWEKSQEAGPVVAEQAA